jgi:hypothetical protein
MFNIIGVMPRNLILKGKDGERIFTRDQEGREKEAKIRREKRGFALRKGK